MKRIALVGALLAALCPQVQAQHEGWIKLLLSSTDFDIYYQPLSIGERPDGTRFVLSLLNYTDKDGRPASIITSRVFDCQRQTKMDQSNVQYSQHWGDGEVVATSGKESGWREVSPGSNGATLLTATCSDTPVKSTQLHR